MSKKLEMFSQFLQLQSSPALEGMTEAQLKELISKLKQDNSSLENEIVKFKTEISVFLNSQNELKSKNLELEKELQQSRLQSKLKISKLQKEISFLSTSNDKTPPPDKNTMPASASPPQSNVNDITTASQSTSTVISTSTAATQSDATPSTPSTVSSAAQSTSSAAQTETYTTQITDIQSTAIAKETVHASTQVTETPEADVRPEVKNEDGESQTDKTNLNQEEEALLTETVRKQMKKEMEEKITNLRNVHKETVSTLAVQIQELKSELVI